MATDASQQCCPPVGGQHLGDKCYMYGSCTTPTACTAQPVSPAFIRMALQHRRNELMFKLQKHCIFIKDSVPYALTECFECGIVCDPFHQCAYLFVVQLSPFSHAAGTSTAVGTSNSNSSKVWSGSIPLQIGFYNITIGTTATACLLPALLTLNSSVVCKAWHCGSLSP